MKVFPRQLIQKTKARILLGRALYLARCEARFSLGQAARKSGLPWLRIGSYEWSVCDAPMSHIARLIGVYGKPKATAQFFIRLGL